MSQTNPPPPPQPADSRYLGAGVGILFLTVAAMALAAAYADDNLQAFGLVSLTVAALLFTPDVAERAAKTSLAQRDTSRKEQAFENASAALFASLALVILVAVVLALLVVCGALNRDWLLVIAGAMLAALMILLLTVLLGWQLHSVLLTADDRDFDRKVGEFFYAARLRPLRMTWATVFFLLGTFLQLLDAFLKGS